VVTASNIGRVFALPTSVTVDSMAKRRGRILIVDDDSGVVRVLKLILGTQHQVIGESNAKSALQRVLAGEEFDLILSDVMMPGMTGIELLAELKRIAPTQAERLIFLTGGASTMLAREGLALAQQPLISKPFDADEILALVAARLGAFLEPPCDELRRVPSRLKATGRDVVSGGD
jgi:CheY-like chemotaxis protein